MDEIELLDDMAGLRDDMDSSMMWILLMILTYDDDMDDVTGLFNVDLDSLMLTL